MTWAGAGVVGVEVGVELEEACLVGMSSSNGEVGKAKLGLQLLPFSIYTTYITRVPPSGFSRQREREELPLKGNSPHPLDVHARAKLLEIT